mmetsp:Transcript_9842/g.16435  ORF Transcript_9842/g.16435 Transcript_9842/m.16435 type:complete len:257 (-) Transcript_9842:38-808(-)
MIRITQPTKENPPTTTTTTTIMASSLERQTPEPTREPTPEPIQLIPEPRIGFQKDWTLTTTTTTLSQGKKNPHRFMDDVRIAMAEEDASDMVFVESQQQQQHQEDQPQKSSQELPPWPGWVKSLAASPVGHLLNKPIVRPSPSLDETKPTTATTSRLGPLSRYREAIMAGRYKAEEDDDDDDDDFHVVVSASVMGDEERAELDRMRRATHQSANVLSMITNMIQQHPHYSFIGFTLLLSFFAYFYSRHRGSEDDVA